MNSVGQRVKLGLFSACLFIGESLMAQPLCDVLLRPAFHYRTEGLALALQDSSATYGLLTTATWSFGDGAATSSDSFHSYTEPGTYTVCLTLTSAQMPNCSATFCRQVVIPLDSCNGDVIASFTYTNVGTNSSMLSDQSITAGEGARLWEFGDGSTSTDPNPEHTWFLPGPHFVSLTRSTGACSSAHGQWIQVDGNATTCGPGLFTDFSIEQNDAVVSFVPDVVTAGFIPAVEVWSFGDGVTDTTYQAEHVYQQPGIYQTCLLVAALSQEDLDTCFALVCHTHEVMPMTAIDEGRSPRPHVWPNPNNGTVVLEWGHNLVNRRVRVSDMAGRTVQFRTISPTAGTNVELQGLSPGNYVLEMNSDQERWTQTIHVVP